MSIGERIKKRREELGMSQLELAKRVGVTQGSEIMKPVSAILKWS